ncbi:tripartite tricarboxylate transporter permease [Candidatus Woesearchaeota archaeon]|nr:tripartite tricarboxylate transporter permease [Candidatus Woesearchaeota archaeon]
MVAMALGVGTGVLTGLLPGIHINLVAAIVASLAINADATASLSLAVFIVAMSISHVFHDFLPSVFLGFSESDSALAVLPGHRMLLLGEGRKAVLLAAFGGFVGILALVLLSPVMLLIIKPVFAATKSHIWLILVAVIAVHFLKNRKPKAIALNALVLALSGLFGIAVFSLPSINQPLLPMFSGLFGVSSLVGGLLKHSSFPVQRQSAELKINKPIRAAKLLAVGLFSSSLMGLFPALGPAQAAMLGTTAIKKIRAEAYMFLLGVIGTASMLFAVLTLHSFGKARNGSIAVMGNILGPALAANSTILLLIVAVVAAAVSCISVIFISRLFSSLTGKVNYSVMSWLVILLVTGLVEFFSGTTGLLVLAVATVIGMVPVLTKSSRQLLMGCLMVPVIGYYL